ncbi:MAG: Universal stress protein family [Bryobacterales bacterium]|nr:Universal stress protein family [Bryobacterales bacterium]
MKLLVAIDHSEASQYVVKEIAARPWAPNSCAEVLNVVEPAHLWTASQTAEQAMKLSADLVHRPVEELRGRGLEASGLILRGDPKRVILDRAQETTADFIFVGSHSASGVSRFLAGNVASAVVRHAPCSVEIVRARDGKPPGVSKILVATDGSEFSERAARSVAERPWPEGTEVEVFSVVELALGTAQALFEPPYVDTEQLEILREEAMKRAQTAVEGAVETLSKSSLKVSESISVLLGGPKTVIIEEADKIGADLIVVGSHGHRGIERFLLGSVSEGVALHAHCSVEVIR